MEKLDAGKKRIEQFVTEVAAETKREDGFDSLLWWGADTPDPAGEAARTPVPLRIYKGKCWRLIEFARSDVEGCVQGPEVLEKYKDDIAQVLVDL